MHTRLRAHVVARPATIEPPTPLPLPPPPQFVALGLRPALLPAFGAAGGGGGAAAYAALVPTVLFNYGFVASVELTLIN